MTKKSKSGSETSDTDFEREMAEASLKSMISWMAPFDGKFYSIGCLMMFMKLITDPNLKKSELALFLENNASISRSTAERYINEAVEAGHLVVRNPEDRPGLEINLGPEIRAHFRKVFEESKENAKTLFKY